MIIAISNPPKLSGDMIDLVAKIQFSLEHLCMHVRYLNVLYLKNPSLMILSTNLLLLN